MQNDNVKLKRRGEMVSKTLKPTSGHGLPNEVRQERGGLASEFCLAGAKRTILEPFPQAYFFETANFS